MSEAEATARRMLATVEAAISTAQELMKDPDRDVRVFALDVYTQLANLELALLTALGEAPADEKNPLARRVRLDR